MLSTASRLESCFVEEKGRSLGLSKIPACVEWFFLTLAQANFK